MQSARARSALVGLLLLAAGVLLWLASATAQVETAKPTDSDNARTGRNFIATPTYSLDEDKDILKLFDGLRVADVTDGMDKAGLQNVGLVSPEIHPLWRNTEKFTHRFVGIAVTARYVPTNSRRRRGSDSRGVRPGSGEWYKDALARAVRAAAAPGHRARDRGRRERRRRLDRLEQHHGAGSCAGLVGVVTDATARDTDEIATEKVPLYFRRPAAASGRAATRSSRSTGPIVCGGVLVVPGDVIVADGDGVVVVPRAVAADVGPLRERILDGDKDGRRKLYEKLGLPADESVK